MRTDDPQNEMHRATVELVQSLMRMNDGELEIAMDMAMDDMDKAIIAEEEARVWRGLCGVRVTMTQQEQIRRALHAAYHASR